MRQDCEDGFVLFRCGECFVVPVSELFVTFEILAFDCRCESGNPNRYEGPSIGRLPMTV